MTIRMQRFGFFEPATGEKLIRGLLDGQFAAEKVSLARSSRALAARAQRKSRLPIGPKP